LFFVANHIFLILFVNIIKKNNNTTTMPSQVTVYKKKDKYGKISGGDPIVSCCINTYGKPGGCSPCQRCQAVSSSGRQCKRTTCIDSKYCYAHLRKEDFVVVAPSRIKGAGLGLFAWTDKKLSEVERKTARPMFVKDDYIVAYGGVLLKQSLLNKIYDYQVQGKQIKPTVPYGAALGDTSCSLDALCKRRAGAYANDPKGTQFVANAHIDKNGLVALKHIYKGDEILINYGLRRGYWPGIKYIDVKTTKAKVNKSVSRTGYRGRFVNKDGNYMENIEKQSPKTCSKKRKPRKKNY
jgi:hypothetical protein